MTNVSNTNLMGTSPTQARLGDPGKPERPISADQLAYVADMIAELQDIARHSRFDTLATILGLAGVEASRQVELLRKG